MRQAGSEAQAPGAPTPDEVDLLQAVFGTFDRTAEWPLTAALVHELDVAGSSIDVPTLARNLDPGLGSLDTLQRAGRATLTVHGIAHCREGRQVLEDVVRVTQFAYGKYRRDGIEAKLSRADVADLLGDDPLRITKASALVQWLPWSGSGSGGPGDDWAREITSQIRAFKDVRTVEDLLAATPRPPTILRGTAVRPSAGAAERDARLPDGLHELLAGPHAMLSDGHHGPAVFEALKRVESRLRSISGLDASGRDLAAKALSGSPAPVDVRRHQGRTGEDEQEGFKLLVMGAIQGLRNPGGHEPVEIPEGEARELLAFANYLLRRLDDAKVNATGGRSRGPEALRGTKPVRAQTSDHTSSERTAAEGGPRLAVLGALQELAHRQTRTNVILDLKLDAIASASGQPVAELQDALAELLLEGLAEPYAATMGQSAEQGACRITGDGLRELRRIRGDRRSPP